MKRVSECEREERTVISGGRRMGLSCDCETEKGEGSANELVLVPPFFVSFCLGLECFGPAH